MLCEVWLLYYMKMRFCSKLSVCPFLTSISRYHFIIGLWPIVLDKSILHDKLYGSISNLLVVAYNRLLKYPIAQLNHLCWMLSVYAATVVYDYKIILRGTKFERTTKPQSWYFTFVRLKRLMLYITTFFSIMLLLSWS